MVSENDLKEFAEHMMAICQISTFPICQINHINPSTDTLWEKRNFFEENILRMESVKFVYIKQTNLWCLAFIKGQFKFPFL